MKILFFEGLGASSTAANVERAAAVTGLIGAVPYLNGGLFESDEDDLNPAIVVGDEGLDQVINGLFEQFNFTITEATPLDVEVAVDPEMLGKIFEELVTGRHEFGSYYTPKPIVSFMCREALKGFLGTAVPSESQESLGRFVDEHDGAVQHPEEILGALQNITVCDPACGSGAYAFTGTCGTYDELHAHPIHVGILEVGRSRTALEDVQVLCIKVIHPELKGEAAAHSCSAVSVSFI